MRLIQIEYRSMQFDYERSKANSALQERVAGSLNN